MPCERLKLGSELRDAVDHLQRCAHGPLGIILVRDRAPKKASIATPCKLGDRALVVEDGLRQQVEGLIDDLGPVLGSICSASMVDPTTSANSAVTGFRSPVSLAARIFSTRGAGVRRGRRAARALANESFSSDCPQLMQKRASAGTEPHSAGTTARPTRPTFEADLTRGGSRIN